MGQCAHSVLPPSPSGEVPLARRMWTSKVDVPRDDADITDVGHPDPPSAQLSAAPVAQPDSLSAFSYKNSFRHGAEGGHDTCAAGHVDALASAINTAPLSPALAQPAGSSVAQPPHSPNPGHLGKPRSQVRIWLWHRKLINKRSNRPKRTDQRRSWPRLMPR